MSFLFSIENQLKKKSYLVKMGCLRLEHIEQKWTPLKVVHRASKESENEYRNPLVLKDHLGQVRVLLTDANLDGTPEVVDVKDYYPFGGEWDSNTNNSEYRHLRLGGERQTSFGLDYDMHPFRAYNPWTGRWMGPDMLSDWAPAWNPYRYGFNNPINNIDPYGLFESRAAARRYAKENDIKTGWFRNSKIREQSDGSYAIENKSEHTSISDDSEYGVMTSALVTTGAPSEAFTNSVYVSGATAGGFGLELGYAQDNYSQGGFYFRFSGEIGFGGGFGYTHQTLTPTNGPITLDNIEGKDLEYNIGLGPIAVTWGGNQPERPGGMLNFTEYGEDYLTDGIGFEPEDILRSNWKFKPKFSAGAQVSFGETFFFNKERN